MSTFSSQLNERKLTFPAHICLTCFIQQKYTKSFLKLQLLLQWQVEVSVIFMERRKFPHVGSWCLLMEPFVTAQQLPISHYLLALSPTLTPTTLPEHWGLIMWASQAFPSADSPAALLIRLELLWGSLRTCSAHLKGDRIGLHCHGNSIPFSPGQGTHRPEPNESLFSAPPHSLLHSCYSTRTTERLRADQLLILFFLRILQLGWLWASVCCERADMTVGGAPQVQRQNTLGLLREIQDAYFIWKPQEIWVLAVISKPRWTSGQTQTQRITNDMLAEWQVKGRWNSKANLALKIIWKE